MTAAVSFSPSINIISNINHYKAMKKNERSLWFVVLKRRLTFILFFLSVSLILPGPLTAGMPQSQTYLVTGTVTDGKGIPLPGVTIRHGNGGSATDNEGAFALRLSGERGRLTFSCIGYRTVTVDYRAGVPLAVTLTESTEELEEVQVIAYGTQRKDLTVTSIATVKADGLKDNTYSNPIDKIQGAVAGVDIIKPTGAPGSSGNIRIRGENSISIESGRVGSAPLYVIDGIPVEMKAGRLSGDDPLSAVASSDIERIDILKDAASCSMYGSRAANGVVLITTRQGLLNSRFRVTASVSHSLSFTSALPVFTAGNRERRFRMEALRNYSESYYDPETNSYKYVGSYRESYDRWLHYDYFWNQGFGADLPAYQDSLNPFYNNRTDLFRYYFRTARVTDASLRLSGGGAAVAYNIGLGYFGEKGVLRNTGFTRVSLLSNLYLKPNARFTGNLRFYLARTSKDRAGKGRDMFNFADAGSGLETIPDAVMGYSTLLPGPGSAAFREMLRRYDAAKEVNESYTLRVNFDGRYMVLPGLEVKSLFSAGYVQYNKNLSLPASLDDKGLSYSGGSVERQLSLLNENQLSYSAGFGSGHDLGILAGISFQTDEMNSLHGFGKGAASSLVHYVPWTGKAYDPVRNIQLKDYVSDREKSALVSLYGRISYNYKGRYMVEAAFRRDGSSRFGRDVRWGDFPSVAVGYNFVREPFMEGVRGVLPVGKLRLSYGRTGRQFEDPYLALGVVVPAGLTFQGGQAMAYTSFPNPVLTWEKTDQYDAGIDLGFAGNRVTLTADYYYRYTHGLLYPVRIPGNYSGVSVQYRNAFAVSNQGVELEVKADLLREGKVQWTVAFNIARNWNRLEKSQKQRDFLNPYYPDNISVAGRPLNGIYVFRDNGIYQSQDEVPWYYMDGRRMWFGSTNLFYRPGDRRIADADGNGVMGVLPPNQDDRVYAGSPIPLASGGIQTTLKWKGFDLNLSLPYVIGRHVLYAGASLATDPNAPSPVYADLGRVTFWKHPGDRADYPANRMDRGLNNFAVNLLSNVYRVSYIKLKQASLGYTLPESLSRRLGFGARVYVSGENLFTLTDYPGPDTERIDPVSGVDNLNNYPLARKVTFGLTLNF